MTRKALIICVVLSINLKTYAQTTISIKDLDGIWENLTDTVQMTLINDGNALNFTYDPNGNIYNQDNYNPYYLGKIDQIGFVSQSDTLWTNVKKTGNPDTDYFLWGIPYAFDFQKNDEEGDGLELVSWNLFSYRKIKKLPNEFIVGLIRQSFKDDRNYLKEFLTKDWRLIKAQKSIIYSSSNHSTPIYLIQGDPVEIIEEKNGWVKIKYYPEKDGKWTGQTIEGWIKKEDVE